MTTTKAYLETTKLKSNKFFLLLFVLLLTKMSFAFDILPSDTIRIDGRIVVIEKEDVEDLQDLPQEDFKDQVKINKYFEADLSFGLSPYGISTVSSSHQQINDFIAVKENMSLSNFSLGIQFGMLLESNWLFESGINFSYHSFNTTAFDIKDLLDSNINQIQNHTFEGFSNQNNDLYQIYREYFDGIGYEERLEKLSLVQNSNKFTFLSIPIVIGKQFDLNKKTALSLKSGLLNTFVISSEFSNQNLINSSNEYKILEDIKFNSYLAEIIVEPGLSITLPSKKHIFYTGLYGRLPLNALDIKNDDISINRTIFGLKIGIIVNLY